MRRGSIVTVVVPGNYGKPRPAVIIQSERLAATDSLFVCLVTSTQRDTPLYRLAVVPDTENGLREASDVMVDKIMAVPRAKIRAVIGRLGATHMLALDRMLTVAIGVADREYG
jgi:mRNA interferase MazF